MLKVHSKSYSILFWNSNVFTLYLCYNTSISFSNLCANKINELLMQEKAISKICSFIVLHLLSNTKFAWYIGKSLSLYISDNDFYVLSFQKQTFFERYFRRNVKRNKVQKSESFLTEKTLSTDCSLNEPTENVIFFSVVFLLVVLLHYVLFWVNRK